MFEVSRDDVEKIKVIHEIFYEVAKHLKKGKSESVYKKAILIELQKRNILVSEEEVSPIIYKEDCVVGSGRIDLMLYTWFPSIIELKAVAYGSKIEYIWQVLSYMETKHISYGFVVNFNTTPMKPLNIQTVVRGPLGDAFLYDTEKETLEKVSSPTFFF